MQAATTSCLNERQKKRLRSLGHALRPVILIGNKGITDSLVAECDRALMHHELVKVKARGLERTRRTETFRRLCDATGAELIQSVGMTALMFRANADQPRIDLSDA